MSVTTRRVLTILSHLLAVALGFGATAAYSGRETAARLLGTPQKRLGTALFTVLEQPSSERISEARDALARATPQLGEPLASVIQLRLLVIAARASSEQADIERASDACRARGWPKCDRESILAMGALR